MGDGIGDGRYRGLQASLDKNVGHGLLLKINMADEDGWAGLAFTNWNPEFRRNYTQAIVNMCLRSWPAGPFHEPSSLTLKVPERALHTQPRQRHAL